MTTGLRVLVLALPLAAAVFSFTRKPTVVGPFSISPYGLA